MSRGTINKAILIGRLGKDPEMRYTPSGTAVVNFSVATNYTTKDQDGNSVEKTDWHRIVAYGKTAEIAGEYCAKGRLVFIEGRIQNRSWEDQNGQKKYISEIVCTNMQLLGSRGDVSDTKEDIPAEPGDVAKTEPGDVAKAAPEEEAPKDVQEEDDLPF